MMRHTLTALSVAQAELFVMDPSRSQAMNAAAIEYGL